jgi:excisionase family DNA binding protein
MRKTESRNQCPGGTRHMNEITGADLGLTTVKGRLLTVKEVADFCHISERTVEKRIKKKLFPFGWFPFGVRSFRADSEDLDDWLCKIKISAGIDPAAQKGERENQEKEVKT